MARGFLIGAVWGTVVAGVGAGAMSLMLGTPDRGIQPEVTVESASLDAPVAEAEAVVPPAAPEPANVNAALPQAVPAPEVEAVPEAEAEPAPEPDPEVSEAPDAVETGDEPDAEPAALPASDTAIETASAETAPLETPSEPTAPAAAEAAAAPEVGEAPEAPEAPASPEPAETTLPAAAQDQPGQPDSAAAPHAPAQEEAPAVSETPAAPPVSIPGPEPETTREPESSEESDPETAASPTLLSRTPAVQQGRLPRIGSTEEPAAQPTPVTEDSPLTRYAAKAEVAEGLPRMAVILIDDGTGPLGPESLGGFPLPVTFAIAPGHPDPKGAAKAWREQGFEVMAIADVPEGASASDVEVIMAGTLDSIPEAIGLLESPTGGVQGSREVSDQVAAYLASTGHGIVMMPKGLNTAQQLALKNGVPSATLFRDFDGEGQDAGVIRRFLDQAAFRAAQEGDVVMLGRLRADTISALMLWGLQDRASSVALAPVSLVLKEALD